MSLISLFLALNLPLAARFNPKPNRLAEALQAELAKAREEITELRRERDVWRGRAYEALTARAIPLRSQQLAQYQAAMQQSQSLAQYQAAMQVAMNAAMQQSQSLALQNVQCQQQNNRAQHVLLGAQNLSSLNPEMFCNCVPARHDLLRG